MLSPACLGTCGSFKVQNFKETDAASGTTKTQAYTIFDEAGTENLCTVLLNGGEESMLKQLRDVLKRTARAAQTILLEGSLLGEMECERVPGHSVSQETPEPPASGGGYPLRAGASGKSGAYSSKSCGEGSTADIGSAEIAPRSSFIEPLHENDQVLT